MLGEAIQNLNPSLMYGVPQGSFLGLLLFSLYNLYADDGQLYKPFCPNNEYPQEEVRKRIMDYEKDVK